MVSWSGAERKSSGFLKEVNVANLYDQLDTVAAYLNELTGAFGKLANRQWDRGRHLVADTARDTEETMGLAASLIIAIGVGVLLGYMIGRAIK
jgi:F0F1-type ATP synthase assembly protein I